jgi:16S rRNA processing protein RimM
MAGLELLAVGRIIKPFGVLGAVVVRSLADSPDRFDRLTSVLVGPNEQNVRPMDVDQAVVEHRGVRLKLRGIEDRNAAETLTGAYLFVDGRHRSKLPRGRFFVHEVVGLRAIDEEGRELGRLREVLKLPAHDVYVIERGGKEFMIPAVKEFVLEINPSGGFLRLRLIEGMAER